MENKKTNSIKKRLGIVAVMLVLVLAIGATAGTTLARYISSATITTETATVAKWGYTITASSEGLFSDAYNNKAFATYGDDAAEIDVQSFAEGSEVVAPGTEGSATMITIKGQSEVDAELTIDVSTFQAIVLANGGSAIPYYPIKWTVGEEEKVCATAADLAELIAKGWDLEDFGLTASADEAVVTVYIPAGTDFDTDALTLDISWEWALDQDKDNEDTLLAYIAADMDYEEIKNISNLWSLIGIQADNNGGARYRNYVRYSKTEVQLGFSVTIKQVQTSEQV